MKQRFSRSLLMATLLLAISITSAKAQTPASKQISYSDAIGDNPDAEADIKLVSDYVNNLVNGDVDKATSVLAANYKGYGPGPNDSTNVEQTAEGWKKGNANQTNRKVGFVPETFNVKAGDLAGHWVATWGSYSFTENGKDVSFPFQYTAHVKDGKIDQDRIYYDQLYILKTLGYTVTPPTPPAK
jgi:ketosteroid isomerase-like protein